MLKKYLFSAVMIAALAISATARESTLIARSESGKVQLTVRITDTDGPALAAQLTVDGTTTDLKEKYDIYSIVDAPNHIITFCFQDKGVPTDNAGTGTLKVWAIPSSFVKTANSE